MLLLIGRVHSFLSTFWVLTNRVLLPYCPNSSQLCDAALALVYWESKQGTYGNHPVIARNPPRRGAIACHDCPGTERECTLVVGCCTYLHGVGKQPRVSAMKLNFIISGNSSTSEWVSEWNQECMLLAFVHILFMLTDGGCRKCKTDLTCQRSHHDPFPQKRMGNFCQSESPIYVGSIPVRF